MPSSDDEPVDQEPEQSRAPRTGLTSRLTFTSELQPRPGEVPLSQEEAADILRKRLGFDFKRDTSFREDFSAGMFAPWYLTQDRDRLKGEVGDKGKNQQGSDLVIRIVQMLPPEMLTTSVMSNIDVRPILSELAVSERASLLKQEGIYINDVYVPADERVIANELLGFENQTVRDQAEAVAMAKNAQGDFADAAEKAAWVEERVGRWLTDEGLGAMPTLDQEIMSAPDAQTAASAELQAQKLTGFEDFMGGVPGLPQDNQLPDWYVDNETLTWMYGMNMYDWNGVLSTEAYKADLRGQGIEGVDDDFMVDTGGLAGLQRDGGFHPGQGPGGNSMNMQDPGTERASNTRVRLLDVYNSLLQSGRKTTEIRNLQDKLIAGGYLDESDIKWEGRGYDPATQEAWRTLVEQSLATKTDMRTLLADATVAKRNTDDDEAKANQRDIVLSSSVGIQTTADILGQQVIGRKLSAPQQAKIVEFIHGLERDSAMAIQPEGAQETEAVDIEAEVQRYIEQENSTEAGAYDLLEQFDVFRNKYEGG